MVSNFFGLLGFDYAAVLLPVTSFDQDDRAVPFTLFCSRLNTSTSASCRLPGTPLGNTGLSWSDVLLGNLPNVYIYAGVRRT